MTAARVSWLLLALAAARPQAQLLQALPGDAVPDLLVECAGHAAIEEHVP